MVLMLINGMSLFSILAVQTKQAVLDPVTTSFIYLGNNCVFEIEPLAFVYEIMNALFLTLQLLFF